MRFFLFFQRVYTLIMKKSVWLHNIRSVHNVGSIFRTADAAGIDHIYLSGYTPLPIDRFGRERSDMAKVAIGAEKAVSWSQIQHPQEFFKDKKSVQLVGIEQDEASIDLFDFELEKEKFDEVVIVMGEEVAGMEDWQRAQCDNLVEIPMYGTKESLNVSVAFGIAAYQVFKK